MFFGARPRPALGAAVVGAIALTTSCNAEVDATDRATCSEPRACDVMDALVAMSDTSSSGVGGVALGGGTSSFFGVDLGRDPQLVTSAGRTFYLARDIDAIFELSPRCGEPLCRFSTRRADHAGTTNPQDVAVAPDGTLWIPRFGLPNVAVLDARGKEIDTVPLPDLDGDGNPNASAIRIASVGDVPKAFVALELLDDAAVFRSRRASALAVIDVATRRFERAIELKGRNPFNVIVEHEGRFFFTAAGNFDSEAEADAGIERLDPNAPETDRLLVSEIDLGGSPSAVAITRGCGAAIVADGSKVNATSVVTFDPDTGETLATASKGGPLFGPAEDFHFWAITWAHDALLVGDRRRGPRGYPIHVWDKRGRCELVKRAEPLWVAQKPVALRALP